MVSSCYAGKRAQHEWVGFKTGAVVCVECEDVLASIFCKDCDDSYCKDCSSKVHSKGKRRFHALEVIEDKSIIEGKGTGKKKALLPAPEVSLSEDAGEAEDGEEDVL